MSQTYAVARCSAGCAYFSTVRTACQFCDAPMAAPVVTDAEGARTIIRNEAEYQAGKAATLAWLAAR